MNRYEILLNKEPEIKGVLSGLLENACTVEMLVKKIDDFPESGGIEDLQELQRELSVLTEKIK